MAVSVDRILQRMHEITAWATVRCNHSSGRNVVVGRDDKKRPKKRKQKEERVGRPLKAHWRGNRYRRRRSSVRGRRCVRIFS